jgi:hypothetical protein
MKKTLGIIFILLLASTAWAGPIVTGSGVNQSLNTTDSPTFVTGTFTTVIGRPPATVSHSATENVTLAQVSGQTNLVTGAYVLSLPTCNTPYKGPFRATTAAVYSLDVVTGTDVIILNGTALAAGNKATSDGTINNQMSVSCEGSGVIIINSIVGVAIDGGA